MCAHICSKPQCPYPLIVNEIQGGLLSYSIDQIDAVNSAIANFSLHNTDPKAELLVSFAFLGMGVCSHLVTILKKSD